MKEKARKKNKIWKPEGEIWTHFGTDCTSYLNECDPTKILLLKFIGKKNVKLQSCL